MFWNTYRRVVEIFSREAFAILAMNEVVPEHYHDDRCTHHQHKRNECEMEMMLKE